MRDFDQKLVLFFEVYNLTQFSFPFKPLLIIKAFNTIKPAEVMKAIMSITKDICD